MNTVEKVINVAMGEVGYLEKSAAAYKKNAGVLDEKTAGAGSDNYTKYGRDMHKIYPAVMDFPAAWCDCFVDWCFYKAYGTANAKGLLAGNFDDYTVSSAQLYKNKGLLDHTPTKGAQVFFTKNGQVSGCYHTGLVYEVDKTYFYTVEGNTSGGSSVVSNGGGVAKKKYSISAYKGKTLFGHPKYETNKAATDDEKTIWNFLSEKGLNNFAVAGIMGNLFAESALDPKNLQNTFEKRLNMNDEKYTAAVDSGSYNNFVKDSAGYGLAQWTYWSRKQGLLDHAKSKNASIGDLNMQLSFLWEELQGYKKVMSKLTAAASVMAASNAVLLDFENPADKSAAVQKKRAEYGQKYYDKYAKKAAAPKPGKTIEQIAKEVIAGKWGSGDDRKKRLAEAGYNAAEVQNRVNAILSGSSKKKTNEQIAKEVIAGKWGSGDDRKKRLAAAGYDAAAVQKIVNKLL